MRKLGKKVTLDKRSLQAYKFCVCSNCPCPSGTSSYSAKASDSERKAHWIVNTFSDKFF